MWVKSASNKSLKIPTFLECIENIVIWNYPMIFIKIQKTLVQIVTKNLLSSSLESIIFPELFPKGCFRRHMQYNFQLPGNRKNITHVHFVPDIYSKPRASPNVRLSKVCDSAKSNSRQTLFVHCQNLDREFPSAERCLFKWISFQWLRIDPECFPANK